MDNSEKLSLFRKKNSRIVGLVDIQNINVKITNNTMSLSFIEKGRNFDGHENDMFSKIHCRGGNSDYTYCGGMQGVLWCWIYRDCNNLFDRFTCKSFMS